MPKSSAPDTIIAGTWYLPATPEHRVGGKLYVRSDGNTVLEVAGRLDDTAQRLGCQSERLIHGIGTDGTMFSLFENSLRSSGYTYPPDNQRSKYASDELYPGFGDYSRELWNVTYYASGSDFLDDETELAAIRVSFSVLREWMSVEGTLESVWQGQSGLRIPPAEEYTCNVREAQVILHDSFSASGTRYVSNIEYAPYFEILDPSSTIGSTLDNWILPLQRLMMFLSSYYADITSIRLRHPDGDKFVELHLQTPQVTTVNLTRMFLGFYLHRTSLEEMEVPLGCIIQNWFDLENEYPYLAEIVDLLASKQYRYDDILLLLLFRAVEFFHENEIGSQRISLAKHKKRVAHIVCQLMSKDDRKWVQDILSDKNKKSSSTVLKEMLDRCGQVGEFIAQHHPKFVRNAIKARNQVVHTGDGLQASSEQTATICTGLVWIVRRLITEVILGSDQIADDYICNRWTFKNYLGETEG